MAAPKKSAAKKSVTQPTQKDHRRSVRVGPTIADVSPAAYWYRADFFKNEDEAQGAFRLAHQQGLDGMGESVAAWMGLTADEYDAWMRNNTLPPKTKKRVRIDCPRKLRVARQLRPEMGFSGKAGRTSRFDAPHTV